MKILYLALACCFALLGASLVSAAIVEHTFNVQNMTVQRLCNQNVVPAVNGALPGPTVFARDGDTLIIHVFNKSPYDISIHWHGMLQLLSGWADGPEYVTQCPIHPGSSYTYKFRITGQEGTLWWHAHSSWLRATVYGALIVLPRPLHFYPFLKKPFKEVPIVFGEWWKENPVEVEKRSLLSGASPEDSDAFTINGLPGDLYPCSQNQMYNLDVVRGKTYLLRIVNAALNNQLFFKIAQHKFKVVAVDASYTKPYVTDVVVIAPGQTVDALFTADQPRGSYYMAASAYVSARIHFDDTTTRGLVVYNGVPRSRSNQTSAAMPVLPGYNDTETAHKFYSSLRGLAGGPQWVPVPVNVDEHMFIAIGISLLRCANGDTCQGPLGQRLSASMNNESFVLPASSGSSMLQAFFRNVSTGVYTADFPDEPPVKFDYTNQNITFDEFLIYAPKSTKVKKLKFNSVVEIVLQNTAFITTENHPIHLHGFNFHVLAQGFGNYDPVTDPGKFNLVDPQIRNTIAVPSGGWAVIRFRANNPGIWLFHCHLDVHMPWGLGMAFEVENGPDSSSTLPPPPADLPKC